MAQAQTVDSPLRLPLVTQPQNRDPDALKDAKLVNCFAEKMQDVHWIQKRPGLLTATTLSGNGYGLYNWKGDQYAVFGATLYKNGVSLGTVDGTGGLYKFSQTLGGTPRLVLGNGVKAYTYDGTTLAEIQSTLTVTAGAFIIGYEYTILTIGSTDFTLIGAASNTIGLLFTATGVGAGTGTATHINFPSSFVKGWAYLDGTLYVMDAQARIWGSNINDPTAWDVLNRIVAQIEPDGGVILAKQLVYVIAFKQWTTEVFYDAGNSVGSPLSPVQGAKAAYGCASADSVQEIDDTLLWITTNRSASPQVARMDALAVKIVSIPAVDRLIDLVDFSTVFAWSFKHAGHRFYVVTVRNDNLTLVYDLDEGLWYRWTDKDGNYWPLVSSSYDASLQHFIQHESNGKIYFLDGDYEYPNDDGGVFPVDIYTPNFDGGIGRSKYLDNMRINADQTPGSVLYVRKSDDDYQTWSNFRKIDLSKKHPKLDIGDSFYKRAYHFRHFANTALRIKSVDLQIDIGKL